jgi:hypothetical protein
MPTLTFFRQARRDGGIRTGIDVDDRTVLSRFEPGRRDEDPALLWYVDVRCTGPRLPRDIDAARQWLTRHAIQVRQALEALEALEALAAQAPEGLDPSEWPVQTTQRIPGATITVAASAVRRPEARGMAATLRDIADHWRQHVDALTILPAA